MLDLARRLAGLVIALVLAAALPLAAVRAGCVCDHGHQDGTAEAEPHICTAACTGATCPMHRKAAAPSHQDHASSPEPASSPASAPGAVRCSCAGDSQALLGQASVAGVLPAVVSLEAPIFARAPRPVLAETPLRLAASPPAPPPRA